MKQTKTTKNTPHFPGICYLKDKDNCNNVLTGLILILQLYNMILSFTELIIVSKIKHWLIFKKFSQIISPSLTVHDTKDFV